MRRRWLALAAMGLALASPVMTRAQGFDCRKASDAVDRAICSTPELATLDTRLASVWQQFQTDHPDQIAIARKDGVVWWRARKTCAGQSDLVGCIRDAELARIARLQPLVPQANTDAPTLAHQDPHAGDAVYQHAKAKMEAAERDGYKWITPKDFFVDKSDMATAGARVMSVGIYGRVHGIEYLFTNTVEALYGGTAKAIPLMTDHADHEAREILYNCDNGPCELRIVGRVDECHTDKNIVLDCVVVETGW
jgi:uncharacterized protein